MVNDAIAKGSCKVKMATAFGIVVGVLPMLVFASSTNGTIDAVNRYAYSENAGWIDLGTAQGNVHVTASGLSGYAWGENVGWISLNCSNDNSCGTVQYGVTNDGNGNLSGYAWSENAGWINFAPAGGGVTIDASGNFFGYAWGENIGWIVFNCATTNSCGTVAYKVSTDWRPSTSSPPPQGGGVGVGGGGSAYDLSIDGGAPSTATTSATLSLYGTMAYTMEVGNTPDFASSSWEPYATTYPWTLTPGAGTKTVYARFRSIADDDLGTVSSSIQLLSGVSTGSVMIGTSTEALQAEIAALEAELQSLMAQGQNGGIKSSTPSAPSYAFTRNLALWDTGADVQALQAFLISEASGSAEAKLQAHGTSQVFGFLTYNALKEFQRSVGITPTGYFGFTTRTYANTHQ